MLFCTFKARMGLYRGMCGLVPSRVSLVKKRSEPSSLRRCLTTDRSSVCMPARTHTHTHDLERLQMCHSTFNMIKPNTHTHARTHTHIRTHVRTHTHTQTAHAHTQIPRNPHQMACRHCPLGCLLAKCWDCPYLMPYSALL